MDYYQYIEAYRTDRLKPEYRARMEEAMASDVELKEAVEHYDKIEPVLDLLVEEELRAELDKIIEASDSTPNATATKTAKNRRLPDRKWWSLAAALVLLIGVFTFMPKESGTVQEMALGYYQPANTSGNKSRGPESKPLQTPADLELYKDAHTIIKTEPVRARKLMQQMADSENKLLQEEVEWYIMLSYLIEGDREKGEQLLDIILANPDHSYTKWEKTHELKEDLKSIPHPDK